MNNRIYDLIFNRLFGSYHKRIRRKRKEVYEKRLKSLPEEYKPDVWQKETSPYKGYKLPNEFQG